MHKGIRTIFLMMGSSCNANCIYCMQGDKEKKSEAPLPSEINNSIYHFIDDMCTDTMKLNKEKNWDGKFTLLFFGGEPLLYFDKIKEIVERVEKINPFVSFSIITNGLLINKEVCEYLNAHNFEVTVSWDGKNSTQTRGFDVFNTKNAENILLLDQLSVNAIISNRAYPEDIFESFGVLNEVYTKIHDYPVNPMTEPLIIDKRCSPMDLDDFNEEKIFSQMKEATLWYLNVKENDIPLEPDTYPKYKIMDFLYTNYKNNKENNSVIFREACCCGWDNMNIDLAGNLYPCHNLKTSLGNIDDMEMNTYFQELMKYEMRETFSRKECNECEVRYSCEGGCKMVTDEIKERYCSYKKMLYRGMIEGIKEHEKNKEVTD